MTGGAGFIGSHLVEALVRRGRSVRVLDDLSSGRVENLERARSEGTVELVVGSVRDLGLTQQLVEGCSQIYHLAASVGVTAIMAAPHASLRNNVEGFLTLFDAIAVHGSGFRPRVVVFSSSEAYGVSDELPLSESGGLALGASDLPRWSYAAAKILGEFLALTQERDGGVATTVIRCFNTCGPRQLSTYGMVIPRFLDQALAGEPITVYGDGRQTRCFSFVGDVVRGVIELADHPDAAGQVFNIGSDQETSVLELAKRVLVATGSTSSIRHLPYEEVFGRNFQDVRRRVPDLTKIGRWIGWRPFTDLDGILHATLEARGTKPATTVVQG